MGRTSGARGQTNRNVRNGQYQRPNTTTWNTPGVEQLKMRFRNNMAGKIMISLNMLEMLQSISLHGFLYYYDKNYDLIRTKSEKPLTPNDKVQYFDSTSKDALSLEATLINHYLHYK
ncbi:unnamed protein product [Rhizophagus irregularis]|nr:unnamed protein product [Rhizophagus irregularis]